MRVVDVNVTLRRPAGAPAVPADGVRDAEEADREAVLEIAERDYTVSRFHLDPQVPDERARALKRAWVDNFFRGARGDRLLVHGQRAGRVPPVLEGRRRARGRPDRRGGGRPRARRRHRAAAARCSRSSRRAT